MNWALVFFTLELYHWTAHMMVLTGIRMLPRKDLVKQKIYFLIDLLSATISYLIHGRALILIILQNIQHAFYFFTWDASWLTKRVISWSSLDWDRGRWNQLDLVSGTLFDIFVHTINVYFLGQLITSNQILGAATVTFLLILVVFYNPKLAWSSYGKIPQWVRKRVQPLSADQRQELKAVEEIAGKIIGTYS